MTIKLMTDEQVTAQIPAMIDAGRSPYGAAHEIGIGLKRLRRLATPEQMTALLINKDKLKHKGRTPLPRKEGLETPEGLRAAIDDAIERGLGINATFTELNITHYTLMQNITAEQEQALRNNRKTKDSQEEEQTYGIRISRGQSAAQAAMRAIIADRPSLGGKAW